MDFQQPPPSPCKMVEYQKKLVILCLIVARLTVVGQPGGGAWWKKYEATDYDEIMQEENTGWLTIGSKVFSKKRKEYKKVSLSELMV